MPKNWLLHVNMGYNAVAALCLNYGRSGRSELSSAITAMRKSKVRQWDKVQKYIFSEKIKKIRNQFTMGGKSFEDKIGI